MNMNRFFRLAIITLLSFPAVAFAQSDRAIELFEQATVAYSEKAYGEAATLYLSAYEHEKRAIFLFNASKSLRSAESFDAAKKAAERSLDDSLHDHPLTEAQKKEVGELLVEIETLQARKKAEEEELRQARLKALEVQAERDKTRFSQTGVVGLSLLGISGGLFGGMAYFNNRSRQTLVALAPPHGSREEYDRLSGELEQHQRRGKLLLYTGMGFAVIGTSVLAWDLMTLESPDEEGEAPTSSLSLGVSPSSATLIWRF